MEEDSEAKKDEYPQELKDATEAALLLASLKYKKLEESTASALHEIRRKIFNDREVKLNKLHAENIQEIIEETLNASQIMPRNPQQWLPMDDDYKPPAFPPVARLNGLIKICSHPFEKQLTASDVNDGQSRLSINKYDVEMFLLPLVKEKEKLLMEKLSKGIPVTTYDSDGNEYPMKFKIWATKIHVLTGGWKKFCHDHDLIEHQDFVTVWMFRHVETGKLCFVITSRRLNVFEPIKRRRAGKISN